MAETSQKVDFQKEIIFASKSLEDKISQDS